MLELLTLLLGLIPAALRSRRELVLENLLLRHQLAVAARPKRLSWLLWPSGTVTSGGRSAVVTGVPAG